MGYFLIIGRRTPPYQTKMCKIGTIGTLAYHPMNQMGVGGTIGTMAYRPMNQMGVGGTIGTLAYVRVTHFHYFKSKYLLVLPICP